MCVCTCIFANMEVWLFCMYTEHGNNTLPHKTWEQPSSIRVVYVHTYDVLWIYKRVCACIYIYICLYIHGVCAKM